MRVALGTGYDPVQGNRQTARNGRVSDLPPGIPNVTIRNFLHRCTAVAQVGQPPSVLGTFVSREEVEEMDAALLQLIAPGIMNLVCTRLRFAEAGPSLAEAAKRRRHTGLRSHMEVREVRVRRDQRG